MLGKTG